MKTLFATLVLVAAQTLSASAHADQLCVFVTAGGETEGYIAAPDCDTQATERVLRERQAARNQASQNVINQIQPGARVFVVRDNAGLGNFRSLPALLTIQFSSSMLTEVHPTLGDALVTSVRDSELASAHRHLYGYSKAILFANPDGGRVVFTPIQFYQGQALTSGLFASLNPTTGLTDVSRTISLNVGTFGELVQAILR